MSKLALLTASFVLGLGWWEGLRANSRVISIGSLSVVSEPDRADVFVDGLAVGATPIEIPRVTAGTHRVRVVKRGYLENARLVTVPAQQSTTHSVKLTRNPETPRDLSVQDPSTAPSSRKLNKWLWVGLAGGAATVATLVLTKDDPPVGGAISVSPTGTGMAGQTAFTFRAVGARDPNGDSLSFAWNFGDGGSGSGETVTHTFAGAGTFEVKLRVSDGGHTVDAPAAPVTVGPNLAGTWTGGSILMPDATGRITVSCGLTLSLTQNGMALTGSMPFAGNCTGSAGALASGSASLLTHPSVVSVASGPFQFGATSGLIISFTGTTSTGGTTLSGNVTLSQPTIGFTQTSATSFTKQ